MSIDDLPPFEQMNEEHEAWQEMCRRLATSIDSVTSDTTVATNVNDDRWNPLIDQIKYWGETLHKLRLADPSHDEAAYAMYKAQAEGHGT